MADIQIPRGLIEAAWRIPEIARIFTRIGRQLQFALTPPRHRKLWLNRERARRRLEA